MDINWIEEEIKIKDLKEYDKNPRYIDKDQFDKLVASLKEDGYHQRIIVTPDNTILGGHQRKKALKKAGFKDSDKIQVLKPDRELSEDEFRRINVRDNLNHGAWDFDALANDWDYSELIEIGFPENLLNFDLNMEKDEAIQEDKIDEDLIKENKISYITCPECKHKWEK
jgi:site-specific DNA-methyltransferase (adenine-specific)